MKSSTIRRWSGVHTWTSLICTLFLCLLALTGLPLIFHHELEHLLGDAPQLREMAPDAPHLDLQQIVEAGERHRPGEVVQYLGWEEDEPNGVVTIMAATAGTEPNSSHTFMLDARSGEALEMPAANGGFMMLMLRLHVDMFAGLPGKLLLAAMGLLFVVAIVSGVVLYAPFMRRRNFASVRHERSRRLRWLDLHNLIGIVTLVWALTVGITGVISACADLLIAAWRNDSLAALVEPYRDAPPPRPTRARHTTAGHCPPRRAWHAAGLHRLSRHTLFQRAPLRGVYERQHAPDLAPVDAGADRCAHSGCYRHRPTSLVHGCAGHVATTAFRRLRRSSDADTLGRARRADAYRPRQRPVPLVGAPPYTAHGAARRGGGMKRWRESTFALPAALGVLSAAGLFAALLGDRPWDALAWLGLGLPALLGVWPLLPRRRDGDGAKR